MRSLSGSDKLRIFYCKILVLTWIQIKAVSFMKEAITVIIKVTLFQVCQWGVCFFVYNPPLLHFFMYKLFVLSLWLIIQTECIFDIYYPIYKTKSFHPKDK